MHNLSYENEFDLQDSERVRVSQSNNAGHGLEDSIIPLLFLKDLIKLTCCSERKK